MAILALPKAVAIRRVEWTLDQPAQVNRSDWTKRRQVVDQPGPALWGCTADLVVKIGEADMLEVEAFLVDLEGSRHSFRLPACENEQIRVFARETVDGAGQGGRTLALKGGVPNTGLLRGHKLEVSDQMVVVMAPFAFGVDGKATVTFKPTLRASPAADAAVELRWPSVLVSLTSSQVGWSVDPGGMYQGKQLVLEEAF